MKLDTDELSPGERYRLLIAAVNPRPIALVSSVSAAGMTNVAPYSFFNAIGAEPMLLMFCPATLPDGRDKDSLRNALPLEEGGTGGFVVNVVGEAIARQAIASGEALPAEESEFEATGLEAAPSEQVAAPRVASAALSFECVTERVLRFTEGVPGGANLVVGRVLVTHVSDAVLDATGRIDANKLLTVGRMGGAGYCFTRDRFELRSGLDALHASVPGLDASGLRTKPEA